jgi:hypothetical protein
VAGEQAAEDGAAGERGTLLDGDHQRLVGRARTADVLD